MLPSSCRLTLSSLPHLPTWTQWKKYLSALCSCHPGCCGCSPGFGCSDPTSLAKEQPSAAPWALWKEDTNLRRHCSSVSHRVQYDLLPC